MKVLAEFFPPRSPDSLTKLALDLADLVDGYDIPESPLGRPYVNSVATAVFLRNVLQDKVLYAHVRLADINLTALLSLALAAEIYGVNALIVTRGDPPMVGDVVSRLKTEEAIEVIKRGGRIGRLKVGGIISLKYPVSDIVRRMKVGADLFLVLRLGMESLHKLRLIAKERTSTRTELIPYVIVKTDRNASIVDSLNQPSITINEVREFIDSIKELVDGIVMSCPMDVQGLVRALTRL
ncbi:MAG: hypothetical protein DRO09_02610 [Thermoprotei archaeon]|nr:MAG: hypothetical protein DRO09_02610 [Thermoprotei archaeon]